MAVVFCLTAAKPVAVTTVITKLSYEACNRKQLLFCMHSKHLSTNIPSIAASQQNADGCRELSDLVVRVLLHPDSALRIIQMCKTAILESSSSFIRHRALSIMRAVTAWLEAADAAADAAGKHGHELPEAATAVAYATGKHDHMLLEAANAAAYAAAKHEHESQHASQPHDSDTLRTVTTVPKAVAAAASTVSKRGAESATPVTPTGAGLARGSLIPRGPLTSQPAVPVGMSESQQLPPQSQQEYQQVVAAMTQSLLQQYHDQEQQQQQQQPLPGLSAEEPAAGFAAVEGMHPDPDASTPSTPSASQVPDDDAAEEGAQAVENAAENAAENANADAASDVSETDEADAAAADADAEQLAAAERQCIVDEAVEKLFEASADMLPLDQAAADSAGSMSETGRSQQGRSGDSGSEQSAHSRGSASEQSAHSSHSSHSRNAAHSASNSASVAAEPQGPPVVKEEKCRRKRRKERVTGSWQGC